MQIYCKHDKIELGMWGFTVVTPILLNPYIFLLTLYLHYYGIPLQVKISVVENIISMLTGDSVGWQKHISSDLFI